MSPFSSSDFKVCEEDFRLEHGIETGESLVEYLDSQSDTTSEKT